MRTSLVVVLFGLTACRHELAKPICVENPADPVCFEPGGDDAGSDAADADAIPASCGDTGPLEEACGKCGRRQRTCVAPGVLGAWGACIDEKACSPGEVVDVAGSCPGVLEKKTKKCGTSCEWEPEVCALPKGWTPIAAPPSGFVGRLKHSVVWTGSEMIVFGGSSEEFGDSAIRRDGARYSPKTNSWMPLSAPPSSFSARTRSAAAWTGKAMFIWGGEAPLSTSLDDGALYDPVADTWTPVAKSPLAGRHSHTAIWTGSRVFVWGGLGTGYYADGALYDPVTNTWTKIPASPIEARAEFVSGWTGSRAFVFGGQSTSSSKDLFGDGALYDPSSNAWSAMPSLPAGLERAGSGCAMTTDGLFQYGGVYVKPEPPYFALHENGVRWTPSGWTLIAAPPSSTLPFPGRLAPGAWCDAARCYVWGGEAIGSTPPDTIFVTGGAAFELATKTWSSIPSANEPSARAEPGVAWTGREAIVWGGRIAGRTGIGDGAIFVP